MTEEGIYEEAAVWLVRQQAEGMDWEAFTAWLEADPRNRAAYDELALIDGDLDEHSRFLSEAATASLPSAANDAPPRRWGRLAAFTGGAIAAGFALVLAIQPATRDVPARSYRSEAGKITELALGDGTKVVLAPASRLVVRGQDVTLQGAGYFEVPHRPGRRLTILAGDFKVSDIGTRFSVLNEKDEVSVDVAEGSLSVSSDRLARPISLSAGQALRADPSSGTVRLAKVDRGLVASWRAGKLQFDQVPLTVVARDISRYSGEKVAVDPAIAEQTFSGVITIGDGGSPAGTLAQILSLDVVKVDGGVRLVAHRR